MPFTSPAEYLAFARLNGILSAERIDELFADSSLPSQIDDFLIALKERGILASDVAVANDSAESIPLASAIEQTEPEEVFTPPALLEAHDSFSSLKSSPTSSPVQPRPVPQMSREKMWTWFIIGGALWLVGFLILGCWMGGCFDDNSKTKPGRVQKS